MTSGQSVYWPGFNNLPSQNDSKRCLILINSAHLGGEHVERSSPSPLGRIGRSRGYVSVPIVRAGAGVSSHRERALIN